MEPTPRSRLCDEVIGALFERIGTSDLRPGQALPPERELAEEMHVSRNVLRQAFSILEDRGVITSRRGAGRYLREIADDLREGAPSSRLELASIADVLEARLIVEKQLVRLACQRRTLAEAHRLQSLAGRLVSWEDNVAFHVAIAAATHNFMLERLAREQIELSGELRQRDYYSDTAHLGRTRTEHVDIAAAIMGRDENRAETLVGLHLASTRRVVLAPQTGTE